MTMGTKIVFIITLIVSIIVPFGYYLLGEKSRKRYKRAIGTNAFFFFGAFAIASIMLLGGPNVQALERVLEDKSIGIVLLTEKFGREFPAIIDTFRLERKMPLLVEIPDRHGTGRKKDFITSYITEAIGLKL